jgi:hypothetical protein
MGKPFALANSLKAMLLNGVSVTAVSIRRSSVCCVPFDLGLLCILMSMPPVVYVTGSHFSENGVYCLLSILEMILEMKGKTGVIHP